MGVSFASYEIARSGLFVNERGLYVTGHNISNVNTPGYVRQQAMITTAQYKTENNKYGLLQYGLGADIQQIRQIRHTFLDSIYRQESTTLGYWESRSKTLQDVQSILGEPMGAGLQNVMNQFWDSWQELSKAPDNLTVRALVRQRGEALVHHANHVGSQLTKLQNDLNSEISVRINEINELTSKIARLNEEIAKVEVSGDSANDFRDQRNSAVDRLCKLANVDVTEMQDGQLAITLGGYFLVTKSSSKRLYAAESQSGGLFYVPKLEGTNIEVPVKGGILKGLMESRGEVFGATGSVENGSPYDKVDLVFAINRNMTPAQRDGIKANAARMINDFNARGINVRLGYVEFDGTGYYSYNYGTGTYDNGPAFVSSPAQFDDIMDNHIGAYGGGPAAQGLDAIRASENMDFRENALKHIVLVNDSVLSEATTSVAALVNELDINRIGVSVIGSTGGAVEAQLEPLAEETGNSYHNINDYATLDPDFSGLLDNQYIDIRDRIYGNIFSSTNIISDVRNQLNLLINVMAREVNSLHRSGSTLRGMPGQDFFTTIDSDYPIEMGNIRLNNNLLDLNNIVASAGGANGDNTIALKIANMRHNPLVGKAAEALSLDDFYRSLILKVGNDGNDSGRIAENQGKLVQSADNQRQSITGVSMDEEMTNMMKYKFAYDASSRVINIMDEMIDTVISRMGLAGR